MVFGSGWEGKLHFSIIPPFGKTHFRKSNENERKMAINTGLKFIEEKNLCTNTKITKVFMGGEPEEFKSLFVIWN